VLLRGELDWENEEQKNCIEPPAKRLRSPPFALSQGRGS